MISREIRKRSIRLFFSCLTLVSLWLLINRQSSDSFAHQAPDNVRGIRPAARRRSIVKTKPRVIITVKPKFGQNQYPLTLNTDQLPTREDIITYLPQLSPKRVRYQTTFQDAIAGLPPVNHRMNNCYQRPTPPPVIIVGDRVIHIDY